MNTHKVGFTQVEDQVQSGWWGPQTTLHIFPLMTKTFSCWWRHLHRRQIQMNTENSIIKCLVAYVLKSYVHTRNKETSKL